MSNRHPSAYPSNPGLEPGTGMPTDGNQFVKTLFNAKTKAEEEYRNPSLPKITLFPWQVSILEEQFPESTAIHDWLSANFDVQIQQGPDLQTVQAKIYADLRDVQDQRMNTYYKLAQGRGKTWLGSQIEYQQKREWLQRGYRVEEMLEVPGVRGLGYSTDQAWIDEPYYTTEDKPRPTYGGYLQEGNAALEEWLQRRSICYRAPSCGLAGSIHTTAV